LRFRVIVLRFILRLLLCEGIALENETAGAEHPFPTDAESCKSHLSQHAQSDATKVAAIMELLDRGFGKAPLPTSGDEQGAPVRLSVSWEN
jgi:hypothetical protein